MGGLTQMSHLGPDTSVSYPLSFGPVDLCFNHCLTKNRYIDQCYPIKDPDLNPRLIFDKESKNIQQKKKKASSTNIAGQNGCW